MDNLNNNLSISSIKNELILDIVYDLMENQEENQDYIKALLIDSLSKRTLEDLKNINL